MFVRFRQSNRLRASLIEARRVGGKIVAEHVGALGSADITISARERFAFWAKLPGRLASLGNRVGFPEYAKLCVALSVRNPDGHIR